MAYVDIKEMLNQLSAEELAALKQVLNEEPEEIKPKKRRSRKEKRTASIKPTKGKKANSGSRTRRKKKKTQQQTQKKYGHQEEIDVANSNNLFLTQQSKILGPPTQEERKAIAFDEKVSRKMEPSERIRESALIEVQCLGCGYWFDVHPSCVQRGEPKQGGRRRRGDKSTSNEPTYRYTCNDCQTSRKPGRD